MDLNSQYHYSLRNLLTLFFFNLSSHPNISFITSMQTNNQHLSLKNSIIFVNNMGNPRNLIRLQLAPVVIGL